VRLCDGQTAVTKNVNPLLIILSDRSGGLRRRSATVILLRLPDRIPTGMISECCLLSGRGLCVGPITRPEESYRVRCVRV
jgi:hypothetical protein